VTVVVREGFFLKKANFSRLANERYDDSMRDIGKLLNIYVRARMHAYNYTCNNMKCDTRILYDT